MAHRKNRESINHWKNLVKDVMGQDSRDPNKLNVHVLYNKQANLVLI